jgi:hypothetical protein
MLGNRSGLGQAGRKFGLRDGGIIIQGEVDPAGTARINAKLQRIIIPRVEFKDATIREAVDFLKRRASTGYVGNGSSEEGRQHRPEA